MQTEVLAEFLAEFLFADGMANGASTEENMQKCMDQVSDSCDSYDLTISIKRLRSYISYMWHLEWKALQGAYHRSERSTVATYLESTLSRVVHIDVESMPGLQRLMQHLADYAEVYKI